MGPRLILIVADLLAIISISSGFFIHPWIINVLNNKGGSPCASGAGSNGTGKRLSPIDIELNKVQKLTVPPLTFSPGHWDSHTFFTVNNTGHLAQFTPVSPKRSLTLSGGPLPALFKLDSLHCHWHPFSDFYGSEHSIDSQRFAMEFHAVYYNKNYGSIDAAKGQPDGLAVCSFIIESVPGSHYNPSFEYLSSAVNDIIIPYSSTFLKYNALLPFRRLAKSEKYYHYSGTVTGDTTEPVKWIIFKDTIHVHPSQVEPFRRMKSETGGPIFNIRETQAKHDRIVYYIDNSIPNVSKKFWKLLGISHG